MRSSKYPKHDFEGICLHSPTNVAMPSYYSKHTRKGIRLTGSSALEGLTRTNINIGPKLLWDDSDVLYRLF